MEAIFGQVVQLHTCQISIQLTERTFVYVRLVCRPSPYMVLPEILSQDRHIP